MNHIALTFLLSFYFSFQLFSQGNNLVVFSEDGYPFYLILNGVRQNEAPETNVKVTGLPHEGYAGKIIFEHDALPDIEKKYLMVSGVDCPSNCEVVYKIKTGKKGDLVLKPFSFTPVAQATPTPEIHVVQYNTTPMPPIETSIQITESTTVVNSGAKENVGVDMNINGVKMGMHIQINDPNMESYHTTKTITTTKTVSTSSTVENSAGCGPMNDADFGSAAQSIESKSFDDSRLQIAKQITTSNCLTARQIAQVMRLFSFEDTRLDYAIYAHPYCFDKNNYYLVNDAFDFELSIEELNDAIGY